ncbi:hypothetical protein REPUB_Repub14bG0036800 [Reevesia pubescens]
MLKFSGKLKYEAKVSWKRLTAGLVKINMDGSVNSVEKIASAGGLIHDANGSWIIGFTYRIGNTSALGAELWGILQGLRLCWSRGFRKVEMKIDSLVAVSKIEVEISSFEVNGMILREIKDMLNRNWTCSITRVKRS